MADRTLSSKIQLRNDTAAKWTSSNPKLLKGEIGIEIDTRKFKIGDGTKNWNSLEYANITDLSNYYTKAELDQAMALINAGLESLEQHGVRRDNPHGVTASQVGAYTKAETSSLVSGKVDKVSGKSLVSDTEITKLATVKTNAEPNVLEGVQVNGSDLTITNKKVNITVDQELIGDSTNPISGKAVKDAITDVKEESNEALSQHTGNTSNPHGVTKTQVGLGNVTNDAQVKRSEMGVANGVATLDSTGKVHTAQLPSYVDDVLEYGSKSSFPTTGEAGKIYVSKDDNKTYRWSGSAYVEISSSLALGETSSTAYRGDRGKTAYDHSQKTSGNPHNVTKSDVGLGNVDNTSDANKPISNATQQAIDEIYGSIGEAEDLINENTDNITQLTTNLNTLKGRVDSAENQLGALEETVSNIKANVYVIDLGQIDTTDGDSFTLQLLQEDNIALTDYGIENVVVKIRDIDKDEIIYGKLEYVDSDGVPVYTGKDSIGMEYNFSINKTQLKCNLVLYKTLVLDCGGA